MSSIKKNIAANFIGKVWTTSISFILLPCYIKIIGLEAYGLVGVYTALLTLFHILDLGLSTSMNREMARMSSQNRSPEDFRYLTRTLEVVYWIIGFLMGAVVIFTAPFIADHWVKAKELSSSAIKQSICWIGLSLTFLWPSSLYNGGLIGLQKQVLLNKITVGIGTLRGIGMLVILTFISPTIQAFFIWQTLINGLQTALTGFFLWKQLPKSVIASKFNLSILLRLKKFALGMTGITIVGIIYSQIDKIFLSRMLTLDMFGYYTLATAIAGILTHISIPIHSVFFSNFNQSVSSNDQERLKHIYHRGCQLMSVFVIPTTLLFVLFAPELIFLWTHNQETVQNTSLLTRLLMIGAMLNVLSNLPASLQFAYGWTKLNFYLNLCGLLVMFPSLYWGIQYFGAIGAAWIWMIVNAGILFISVQRMHRRLMKLEKWRWYLLDVSLPMLASLMVLGSGRLIFSGRNSSDFLSISFFVMIFLLALIVSILVFPDACRWLIGSFLKWRQSKILSNGS